MGAEAKSRKTLGGLLGMMDHFTTLADGKTRVQSSRLRDDVLLSRIDTQSWTYAGRVRGELGKEEEEVVEGEVKAVGEEWRVN